MSGFYQDLRQDYLTLREKSVLIEYLRERPEKGSTRELMELAGSADDAVSIRKVLEILVRNPRIYQTKYETSKGEEIIPAIRLSSLVYPCLGRERPEKLIRTRMQKDMETLCTLLESGDKGTLKNLSEVLEKLKEDGSLREILEELVTSSLHICADRFLYDHGAPVQEKEKKGRDPRNNAAVELLELWAERYGTWPLLPPPEPLPGEVSAEDCERLYSFFKQRKRDDVLFPLRVDPLTGMSLYIVGRKFWGKTRLWKNPCCCLGLLLLDMDEEKGNWNGTVLKVETEWGNTLPYPDVQTALDDLRFCRDDMVEFLGMRCPSNVPKELGEKFPLFSLSSRELDPEDREEVEERDRKFIRDMKGKRQRMPSA